MKIGFLGMSGIRAKDEKLLELGLTLPGFVDRSKVVASLPSLGVLYLAACTPRHHELCYFEAPSAASVPAEVYGCDVVAISSLSAQISEAYQVADTLRVRGVTVVMGGLHVSTMPNEAASHADHVVVGEGELVWPKILEAIENGEKGAIWNASKFGAVDVSLLPVPRYDLLLGREYNRFTVQTSRGCPWRCDFCASSVMLRQKYRKRPVETVIRDIKQLIRLFGEPYLEFADDNTFVDKRWGKELCRELAPLGLKWFTETDISVSEDEELLGLMREAGCRQVLIGLESPTQGALSGIELRANFKARAFDSYRSSIERIQSHGITVNGCFILGLDSHTPRIFEDVLSFANEAGLYEVQITVLTPFPGTPLYNRLLSEGRLIDPYDWDSCTLFDVNFTPRGMSADELRNGLYWLSENLYAASAIKSRRRKFFKGLKDRKGRFGLSDEVWRAA
ncbi:MAG: B12-binding domain-containing radical SAM protein [Deltaproteobacteria bacterium]|nr:B12-binding domain-containing radical SAM protein [Deltaproteobacteria bacterium]